MSLTNSSPLEVAQAASLSSRTLAVLSAEDRDAALTAIHAALANAKDVILEANRKDVELAKTAAAEGKLSQSVLGRLDLAKKGKWEDMLQGILDVRDLINPGKPKLSDHLFYMLIIRTVGPHEVLHPGQLLSV
jgi:glutamate-5-semialdehyde dehydrogenase